jgi:predicted solute-binding protein
MDKQAVKDAMFGGIMEMMRNRKYYYFSSVGGNYCHWTDEGKEALQEYMQIISYKLWEAEEADLKKRSKEMVLKGLKGEEV